MYNYDISSGQRLPPPGFWTEVANAGYEKLSNCIENQYWNFTVDQLPEKPNVDGTRTLDENLADIGGVRLAYFGYRKYKTASISPCLPYVIIVCVVLKCYTIYIF